MGFLWLPHVLLMFFTSGLMTGLAVYAWQRRGRLGGLAIGLLMAAGAVWTFAAGVEAGVVDPLQKILWSKMEYIGFINTAPLTFIFVVQYFQRNTWITPRRVILLWIIPLLTLALAWTNEFHGLIWPGFSLGSREMNVLVYQHGIVFWIMILYEYWLFFLAIVILVRFLLSTRWRFRWQGLAMIAALLFPAFGGIIYLANISSVPGLDWSPIYSAMTGIVLWVSTQNFGFLDLVPIARESIFELMQDAVVVLDCSGRVIELNPAAKRVLGNTPNLYGEYIWKQELFSAPQQQLEPQIRKKFPAGIDASLFASPIRFQTMLQIQGSTNRYYQISISPLQRSDGPLSGHLLYLQEVTALHQAEENLRIRQQELEHLINLSPWQVAYLDAKGKYMVVNEGYASFFGLTELDFIDQSIREVIPEEYRQPILSHFQRAVQGEESQFVLEKPSDGEGSTVYNLLFSPVRSQNGLVDSICIYHQNITAQHEKEMAQEQIRHELEDQVKERTYQLEQTITNLEKEIQDRRRAEAELRDIKDHLVERVSSQSRKLAGLYEVIIAGTQMEEENQLLDHTLERVTTALECSAAAIHEWHGNELRLIIQRGLPEKTLSCMGLMDGQWITTREIPLPVGNVRSSVILPETIRGSGFSSFLGAAVRQHGKVTGLLSVFWEEEHSFSVEDISLASAIAEELGVILENIHLRQRIEQTIVLKERRRLARDIHDSVSQSLHSLVLAAYSAKKRLEQGDLDRLDVSLELLSQGASQALREMRLLLYEMRLEPVSNVDMVESLRTRLQMVEERAGIDGSIEIDATASWVKAWEGDLFCIASEALNNSLKHSGASKVTVMVCGDPSAFLMQIEDNGCGFNPQTVSCGMGLVNMKERAERLGGKIMVDSVVGQGTKIIFQIGAVHEPGDGKDA
jgi:PAS domain S-box-containing protein